MGVPLFSILHSSARPDKWREIYDAWMKAAVHPEQVEYVLCVDERWGFVAHAGNVQCADGSTLVTVFNEGRRCYVDGVNTAAKFSSGRILIVNADDQYPCEGWDRLIENEVSDATTRVDYRGLVVRVSTGTPDEHKRRIMVMPILSRPRYEKLGYIFYPGYESMFADRDFVEEAERDGVIIEARELPVFPHRHPLFDHSVRKPGIPWNETDPQYQAQNRKEAWDTGLKLFAERWPNTHEAEVWKQQNPVTVNLEGTKRTIALCLTGEHFEGPWVDGILDLYSHFMQRDFAIYRLRDYTSNVYVTRENIRQVIVSLDPKPDLVLWIDDDNLLTPGQFDWLLSGLDEHPELDGITAWCWIHDDEKKRFMPSCGMWAPDHIHWQPFDSSLVRENELRSIEVTGFPAFLMRYSALEKAGDMPFLPVLDQRLPHGLSGEDLSFCLAAEKGGARFAVDPRVRIPHLKYVEVNPILEEEGAPEAPRIAVMMRVKNEARWIERVIRSVIPVATLRTAGVHSSADVFVMDDGSTDDTAAICQAAGATVIPSPFVGQGLDESRDKTWLLKQVREYANPDWILCIDGDEELEPNGPEKIKRALATNPRVDCFNLRFLFLWDAVDQVRLDGVYSALVRQSLFRVSAGSEFTSYYEGCGTHSGLHVSNAPYGLKAAPLNVYLLHYGYLHQADRLKKYEWYNRIDPNNEIEDRYRHIVQGDIPEVPASAKLKHGGPLDLRKLPPHLAGKALTHQPEGAPRPGSDPAIVDRGARLTAGGPHLVKGFRLNLGCSDRLESGFLNVDRAEPCNLVVDLSGPWPWVDGSVDFIRAWDLIEHLPDKNHTMNEAFRVLRPGGQFDIIVPTTDGRGAWQDPDHKSFWNRNSFFYFTHGDPHLHRFAPSNGVRCAYRIVAEHEERLPGEVVKLHILLEAVKQPASAAAD